MSHHWGGDRTWEDDHVRVENLGVPEHTTARLTIDGDAGLGSMYFAGKDWVFTFARTGCLRVQRGDFCAYVPVEGIDALVKFLQEHRNA